MQGQQVAAVQGHIGTCTPRGDGCPTGEGARLHAVWGGGPPGRRGTRVFGQQGTRAKGYKGVCAQRCSTQHHRGAKVYMFFLGKNSAFDQKMNPAGPGWRSGRGAIGFCHQSWLPLPDWGTVTSARDFFSTKKLCVHGHGGVHQGEGHPFPKNPNNIFSPVQPGLQHKRPY